ncbi:hypothetical protein GCM10023080_040570 [Streptomyces pseudoechinosporeus]
MPPCPATSPVPAPRAGSFRKNGLVRTTLCFLLFLVLACVGDEHHASERSYGRSAVSASDVPLSAASFEEDILEATEPPDHCHGFGPGPATAAPSAARVLPLALTTGSPADTTDNLTSAPSKASRSLPLIGGRCALIAICRWRI